MRQTHQLVRVQFSDKTTLIGTPAHPIWSVSVEDWVDLEELEEGDLVLGESGPLEVVSTELLETLEPVYNLEVYGEHVYHVENSGILVHNGRGRYKAPKAKKVRAKPKAQSATESGGRRKQGPDDVTLKTRLEAFLEAMRRNGGSLEVFDEIPQYMKNPNCSDQMANLGTSSRLWIRMEILSNLTTTRTGIGTKTAKLNTHTTTDQKE